MTSVRKMKGAPGLAYLFARKMHNYAISRLISPCFDKFGPHSSIAQPMGAMTPSGVSIGSGVALGPGCSLMVDGAPSGLSKIVLEDGVSIAGGCTISAFELVRLERDVLLARGVYISDHKHAYENPAVAIKMQGVTDVAPVVIGEGAWLGQNVVVAPGVRIGRGAVVAANSLVNRDVPEYSLAVGSPARTIRSWSPQ